MKTTRMVAILVLTLGLMVSTANGTLTLPYHGITSTDGKAFWVSNTYAGPGMSYGGFFYAAGQEGRGVLGQSDGGSGMGVKGWAKNSGDVENYGGHFTSAGERGIGVYGWAENTGNVQNYGGKFLAEGTRGIGIQAKGGPNGFAGEFEGDVKISGAGKGIIFPDGTRQTTASGGGAAGGFPCPAYDSGWVPIAPGEPKTLYHNLGGNVDNYVVDMQFKHEGSIEMPGIHNQAYGGNRWSTYYLDYIGASWSNLTTSSIKVYRHSGDTNVVEVRIRIWVYECSPVTQTGVCCYESGDRVRLLVDNPRDAVGLPAGTVGTVLCCNSDDPEVPILVSWDEWFGGYNRDLYCDTQPPRYPNNSTYWMACDQIERASREGYFDGCGVLVREVEGFLSFHADAGGRYLLDNYYDFQVGDRIRVRGLVVLCLTLVGDVDGCIGHPIISHCAE